MTLNLRLRNCRVILKCLSLNQDSDFTKGKTKHLSKGKICKKGSSCGQQGLGKALAQLFSTLSSHSDTSSPPQQGSWDDLWWSWSGEKRQIWLEGQLLDKLAKVLMSFTFQKLWLVLLVSLLFWCVCVCKCVYICTHTLKEEVSLTDNTLTLGYRKSPVNHTLLFVL